jgi:hypothetical protein
MARHPAKPSGAAATLSRHALDQVREAVRQEIAAAVPKAMRAELLRIGLATSTEQDATQAQADFRFVRRMRDAAERAEGFVGRRLVDLLLKVIAGLALLGLGVGAHRYLS